MLAIGFPKKDARFSKLKDVPDLLSDDREGKIIKNIQASFMGSSVCIYFVDSS